MQLLAREIWPITVPLLVAAASTTLLALYIWQRKNAPGSKTGPLLMLACVEWILCYVFELAGVGLPTKVFWNKLQYLGIASVPTLWLAFTLEYTGRDRWLTRRNLLILSIVPVVGLLLILTNDAHALMWTNAAIDPGISFPLVKKTYAVGLWVFLGYTYVLLLLSAYFLAETLIRSRHLYRWQASALLIGVSVPSLGGLMTVFGLNPYPHLDLEVLGLVFSSFTVAWCVFDLRLMDIVPVAREAVIESMNDAIIVLDANNRVVDINRAAQELIGYSAAESVGWPLDQIWPHWTEELESNSDEEGRREVSLGSADKPAIYDVSISPLLDWKGHVVSKVVVLRDITERKRSEEALRESEKRYSTILDAVPDMVYEMNLAGTLLYANRYAGKVLGYTGESLGKLNLIDLLDDEGLETAYRVIKELAEGKGAPQQAQYNIRTVDGHFIPIEAHVRLLDKNGQSQTILGVARDIAERKKAEQMLRQSEEKYRTLFEESKDVLYMTTPDGQLLDINPAGLELYGYDSKEEMLQINVPRDLYMYPSDREKFRKAIEQDGFVKDYELWLKRKDGRRVLVLITANVVCDEVGVPVAYRGTMRDITEKKQLEQQFFQAQKMESIGTLAGGIAHDFNNLLGGILGYASFMKSKIQPDSPFINYLDTIEKSAIRASELTTQLLAFARGGKYNIKPVALNRVIGETLDIIRRTFDKSIEIETHLDTALPTVEADAAQMQQILMNLCLNARDAMPAGGKLMIETRVSTLDEAYAKTHMGAKPGRYVTLLVTDTGIGMDEKIREKVFEPFFTTKEKGKGTGLGLSMVYGVVKNHGGYVCVYSEPGVGSTFKVYFPASGKPEAKHLVSVEMPRGKNELILVVDDEEAIRSLARDTLEAYGYRVWTIENGAEAVAAYTEHKDDIDLVILDMVMPKMGGHETFLKLKEINPSIRALLSTGYSQNGKAQEILDSGVMGFLQKPYQLNELLCKLKDVLNGN